MDRKNGGTLLIRRRQKKWVEESRGRKKEAGERDEIGKGEAGGDGKWSIWLLG